jgi:hypothetical protein
MARRLRGRRRPFPAEQRDQRYKAACQQCATAWLWHSGRGESGQNANIIPGRTGLRIKQNLPSAADGDRVSHLQAPEGRIQVIDAGIGKKIAGRKVISARNDAQDMYGRSPIAKHFFRSGATR